MLARVILHTSNSRVPLRLLLTTQEEQNSTSNQDNTSDSTNDNTGNSSTTQLIRLARLALRLRSISAFRRCRRVSRSWAGSDSRTSCLVIVARFSCVEAGDRKLELGLCDKGDVGAGVEGLVVRCVPVGAVDDLQSCVVAG